MPRGTLLGATVVLVLAIACVDSRHSNPFDPVTPVTVKIFPETLFSVANGPVTFTLATEPPFTDPTATWATDTAYLIPSGNTGNAAVLYSHRAPLWPLTETVPMVIAIGTHYLKYDFSVTHATAPSRTLSGSVVLTQRLVRIHTRCAGPVACDSLTSGALVSVFVDGFDALGSPISGLLDPAANPLSAAPVFKFTVRDTSVASAATVGMRAAAVTAKRTGSTWLVAQRDSSPGLLQDSLRIVVR